MQPSVCNFFLKVSSQTREADDETEDRHKTKRSTISALGLMVITIIMSKETPSCCLSFMMNTRVDFYFFFPFLVYRQNGKNIPVLHTGNH